MLARIILNTNTLACHSLIFRPDDVWFDHRVAVMIKSSADALISAISSGSLEDPDEQISPEGGKLAAGEKDTSVDYHDSVVTSYKELIRQQDEEIQRLKVELEQAGGSVGSPAESSAPGEVALLRDELASIKAQNEALAKANRDLIARDSVNSSGKDGSAVGGEGEGAQRLVEELNQQLHMALADQSGKCFRWAILLQPTPRLSILSLPAPKSTLTQILLRTAQPERFSSTREKRVALAE